MGLRDDPGIKWHLDTAFYLLSASYLAIFFLLVDTVFQRHQNQTRVNSICCGGSLKELTWLIFLKEKAFATCGLSASFYPFSDHANHMETGWQTV